uniref:Uncharacterized protein n=1 Tax=Streptomyces sp. NBC_00119 TaxID=2975659 RepID=A0AAU1UMN7_9ACTN
MPLCLPDIAATGQSFIDFVEIDELTDAVHAAGEKPGADIAAYRYRLDRARRRAARGRLEQLISTVDTSLPVALKGLARDSLERLQNGQTEQIEAAVGKFARLLGDFPGDAAKDTRPVVGPAPAHAVQPGPRLA